MISSQIPVNNAQAKHLYLILKQKCVEVVLCHLRPIGIQKQDNVKNVLHKHD
jgi:hypothetical protein